MILGSIRLCVYMCVFFLWGEAAEKVLEALFRCFK